MNKLAGKWQSFTAAAPPFTDISFRLSHKMVIFVLYFIKPAVMTTLEQIESFLAPKKLAVVGASRNPKKFGRVVYEDLKGKGFTVWAVNPNAEKLDADPCYPDIASLPPEVDRVFIVTPPEKTAGNVKQALDKGIRNIWIQQRSDTLEALEMLKDKDVNLIHDKCIFMFAAPVKGAHNFHRFITRLFGRYPK